MKKNICLLVFFIAGLACCNSSNTNNSSVTANLDSANILVSDSINSVNESSTNIQSIAFPEHLKKYLTARQVDSFEIAAKQYNSIKSSTDLAEFYLKTLPKLLEFIRQGVQKSNPYNPNEVTDNVWYSFKDYMPFIMVDAFNSDSEEIWPVVNLFPLYKLAKQTPEIEDDYYFKLAVEMYSKDVGKDSLIFEELDNIWSKMDFENMIHSSNLGQNIIYKLLKMSEQSLEAGKTFEEKINTCRQLFIPEKETHYWVSKKEALAEIEKILNDCKLKDSERKQIIEVQLDIKTNPEVQFNCKDGNCTLDI